MQQQMAATVEEQMMVKAIRDECPWETLPKRIQAAVVSKDEWHRRYVRTHARLYYCKPKRINLINLVRCKRKKNLINLVQ